jgi:hypothetical protein
MTVAELRYIGQLRYLKMRRGADKAELVAAIVAFLHPAPAPASATEQYTQEKFA